MVTQRAGRTAAGVSAKFVKRADGSLRAESGSNTSESKGTSEERTHHE